MLCNANGLTLFQLGKGLKSDSNRLICNVADSMPDKTVVIEEFIEPSESTEISVIVAIDAAANVVHYEPVVMSFHSERNILDRVQSSTGSLHDRARNLLVDVAVQTAKLFGVGLFAVEMFYLHNYNRVLVNEVAPRYCFGEHLWRLCLNSVLRVHNSGHHTIESCDISQFEMASRIVLGLPITQPKQLFPFFEMSNLLGIFDDSPYIIALHTGIAPHNVFVHDYGKGVSKKWRKLGHITSVSLTASCTSTVSLAKVIKPSSRPQIGIVMGSETDESIMQGAVDVLRTLGECHECKTLSFSFHTLRCVRCPV